MATFVSIAILLGLAAVGQFVWLGLFRREWRPRLLIGGIASIVVSGWWLMLHVSYD